MEVLNFLLDGDEDEQRCGRLTFGIRQWSSSSEI